MLGFGMVDVKFIELLFWWIMKLLLKILICELVFENVVLVRL